MLKLLFPVLLLFSPVAAFACSCSGPPPPDMSYAGASTVFIATITTLKPGEFHITRGKSWKGNAPAEFVVPQGPCSMENVQSAAEQETLLHAFAHQLPGAAVTEADSDGMKDSVKRLLDSWRAAP
jgi:hypothetical protein